MRYVIRRSFVIVLGRIWWPMGAVCSLEKTLSAYDVENMRDCEDGVITRDSVDRWVSMNSGDFSEIVDWSASIEDGDSTLDFPWSSEENEIAYLDTMCDEEA